MTVIGYGFNIDTFNTTNGVRDIARAAGFGASRVRVSIEQDFGGSGGPIKMLQAYRKACDDHGLLLLNTCQPTGHVVPTKPAAVQSYASYFADCANVADLTGIVNELNLLQHPAPGRAALAPADWAAVTMACLAARDAHAPGRAVLLGEIADLCSNGPKDPLAWYQAYVNTEPSMLLAGNVSSGWHGYCASGYNPTKWPPVKLWNSCKRMEDVYAFNVTKGAGDVPICNTEFGADSEQVGLAGQARRMTQYDQEHRKIVALGAKVDWCCWYTLRDHYDSYYPLWGMVAMPGDTNKPVAAAFTAATKRT